MKVCSVCGASYEDDALFCEKCGSSLTSQEPVQQEADETPVATPEEEDDEPSTVLATPPSQKPAKKGNKKLVWALVILLLLGALGGGGYYLYSEGMLDDIFGKSHKSEAVDDEDDEDEDDMDDEDEDKDEDRDYDDEDDMEEVMPIEEEADSIAVIRSEIPEQPTQPTQPGRQEQPTQPTQPVRQEQPTQPVRQEQPAQPTQPVRQQQPVTQPVITTPPVTQPTITMVTVTTNIPRAMVVVDGVDAGWAPWSGQLTPGYHTFALKAKNKEKLRTQDFGVNVSGRSQTIPINVADPSVFE